MGVIVRGVAASHAPGRAWSPRRCAVGTPRPYPGMPGRSAYYLATEYLVNAPPAWLKEFGPSAAYTLPSASTVTPSPAVP